MKLHRNSTFTLSSTAARRRILSLAGLAGAAMAVGLLGGQLQADTTATWTGAYTYLDYWVISANWALGGLVPNNGSGIIYDVRIPSSASSPNSDLFGISPVIGQLTTQVGTNLYNSYGAGNETLTIDPSTMTVQAGSNIAGTVSDSSTAFQTLNFGNGHASAVTSTISGVVSGNVALIVDQPTGSVVLSGANTYTGGTTINGGTLSISSDSNLGTGGITFGGGTLQTTAAISGSQSVTLNTSGGTIDTDGQSDTLSGNLSGAGGLTVESSLAGGVLILSGADTASGSILINSPATLEFSGDTTGFTGNITDNSALVFGQTADSSLSGIIAGSGTLTQNGTATLTLSGANNYSGTTTISSGTLEFAGSTAGLTGNVTDNSALSFNQTANSSLSGIISGTGTVTEAGSAGTILTLSGANTYSGGTALNAGTLSVSAGDNLGTGALTFNGGTLLTTAASTFSQGVTVNASGGIINTNGFTDTFNGFVNGSGTLTVTGGGTAVLNNSFGFGLGPGYAIEGNSTINLSGFGPGGNNNSVTFSGNTTQGLLTYGFGGPGDQLNNVTISDTNATTTNIIDAGDGTLPIDGQLSNSDPNATLVLRNGYFDLSGPSNSGFTAGTLEITGNATARINNTSSFGTGAILALNSGTVIDNTTGLTFTNAVVVDAGGGTLDTNDKIWTISGGISGSGNLTVESSTAGGTLILSGADTATGSITINSGTTLEFSGNTAGFTGNIADNSKLIFAQTAASSLSGIISGSGTLTQNGTAALTLSGANTYTGGTTLDAGTVSVSSGSNLGTGPLTFNGGTLLATAATTLSQNIDVNSGGGTIDGGGQILTLAGALADSSGTLTLQNGTIVLGSTSNATDFAGGTLQIGAGTGVGAGVVQFAASANLPGGGAGITLNNGELDYTGSVAASVSSKITLVGTTGNIVNVGNGPLTLSGAFSGTGNVTLTGTAGNTITLTGDSGANNGDYSGGVTITGGITVVFANNNDLDTGNFGFGSVTLATAGDTLQYGANNIELGNSMAVNAASAIDVNGTTGSRMIGTITGSGALTIMNSSATASRLTLAENAANTYSGAITIGANATLALSGSASIADSSGVTLDIGGGANSVLDISGLTNGGASLASLASAGVGAGPGTASVVLGANTLTITNASGNFAGVISGTGGLTLSAGTETLSGANTYSGTTTITSGTLEFTGSTAGLGGNVIDNSALSFNQPVNSSLSGIISGTGTVAEAGAAGTVLTLSGANSYSGTTTITSGALEFTGSTAGLSGNVIDNSALSFNQTASSSLSGIISGIGTLTEAGSAGTVLTLSGANSYSGTTTITSGTLEFTGSTAGLTGDITDNSALIFAQTAASSLSGLISGSGTLMQDGTAALTLSAANTYTGGTTINSGALIAANNAALGTGTVALAGGTLETPLAASAGASGANITLNTGTYTQSAGTTLGLALSGTPGSGNFDSLNVQGSASLNGALDALVQAGAKPAAGTKASYNIITTTGGVSGNFSSITLAAGSATGFSYSGAISGNDYVLTLSSAFSFNTALSNYTPTQLSVANYLDTVGNSGTLPAGPLTFLQSLAGLTPGQLSVALTEIAPNAYTNIPNTLINASIFNSQALNGQIAGQFEGGGFNDSGLTLLKTTNTDPFSLALASALQSNSKVNAATTSAQYLDDVMQPAQGDVPLPSRETAHDSFGGFIAGQAILGSQPTSTSGQNYFTGGINSGLDYRFAKSLLVGISFDYSYTNAHVDGVGSVLTDNSYAPGLFAGYRKDNFYADVSADYTYTQFSIHRNLNIGGTVSTATGKPDTNQADLNTLIGYNFPVCSHFKAGPAIGLDYTHVNVSSYSETGSPGDLSVSRYSIDSLRSLLGGQAEYKLMIPKMPMPLTISANAFWQHEYLNNSHGITAALAGAGSGSFITNVSNPGRDSALIGAGVSGKVCRYATLFANYEAQIGPKDQHSQSIMVGMAVSF